MLTYQLCEFMQLTPTIAQVFAKPTTQPLIYLAGQYVEIQYPDLSMQPFTIANTPQNEGILEFHIRLSKDDLATAAFIKQLKATKTILLQGPNGHCTYSTNEQPILFLCGGTGFAQAKALIEFIKLKTIKPTMHLYWAVKTPEDFYLANLPEQWLHEIPQFRYTPLISQPISQSKWKGLTGYAHLQAINDYPNLNNFKIYVSGPFAMVQTTFDLFQKYELNPKNFYSDMIIIN